MIGYVADASRFPSLDRFAAYNGTAPIEVSSSGNRKIYRLPRRGNRRLNHAIHMAAVTQIRHPTATAAPITTTNSPRERHPKEALRCLKRRVSDAIYAHLQADARRATAADQVPGRATGERLCRQRVEGMSRGGPGAARPASGPQGSGSMPCQGGTSTVRWPGVPPRMIFRRVASSAVLVSRSTCSGLAIVSM